MALELGVPAMQLARSMPMRELYAWQAYARRRLLPSRRLEYYLAQIACLIAVTMGGARGAKISDFMLDREPGRPPPGIDDGDDDVDLEALKVAFNFKPRNA